MQVAKAAERHPLTPTVFSSMCVARCRPPSTAAPVQTRWPRMPPKVTPKGSSEAANLKTGRRSALTGLVQKIHSSKWLTRWLRSGSCLPTRPGMSGRRLSGRSERIPSRAGPPGSLAAGHDVEWRTILSAQTRKGKRKNRTDCPQEPKTHLCLLVSVAHVLPLALAFVELVLHLLEL